ncbi:MAG: peptide ABC transporter permease [Rhodospirillaceae bacterium]|nr:peptide ABC transporter permease [Rhodospirillaceae bacterium]
MKMVKTDQLPGLDYFGALEKAWYYFRKYPIIPVAVFFLLVFVAVFAPMLAPFDPAQGSIRTRHIPPMWLEGGSAQHFLGTDSLGRDMLSRVMYGARIALMVAVSVLFAGGILGTIIGMFAGYLGGLVDEIAMRTVDLLLAMPFLLVALTVVIVFGQSLTQMIILLILFSWDNFARVVRAESLRIRNDAYVDAARVAGASDIRIVFRHILPGVFGVVLIVASLRVGQLILIEATLSFLGAGLPKSVPAWGVMVADGQDWITTAWWVAAVPGFMIFVVVMSFNFLGDWLRDYFDPRLRQRA